MALLRHTYRNSASASQWKVHEVAHTNEYIQLDSQVLHSWACSVEQSVTAISLLRQQSVNEHSLWAVMNTFDATVACL